MYVKVRVNPVRHYMLSNMFQRLESRTKHLLHEKQRRNDYYETLNGVINPCREARYLIAELMEPVLGIKQYLIIEATVLSDTRLSGIN